MSSTMPKKFCDVNGYQMAYVDAGSISDDHTLVFLHGNPTSSYLWRNIIRPLEEQRGAHCIAPDLIGMGDSDKLNNTNATSYRMVEHAEYLDEFLDKCVGASPENPIILIVHDWGSGLGFWWAFRHPNAVAGIVYMEAMTQPWLWEDFPETTQELFRNLRTPQVGEQLILEENFFIEAILPSSILRNLTMEEMDEYRRPFLEAGEGRRSMLTWPREVSFNGTPADVTDRIEQYGAWLAETNIPKLFINANPGAILTGDSREFARTWKNQTEVTVDGLHFIQEDSPQEVAEAINNWLDDVWGASTTTTPGLAPTSGATSSQSIGAFNGGLHFWLLVLVWGIRFLLWK